MAEAAKFTLDDIQLKLARIICEAGPGADAAKLIMQLVVDTYDEIDRYTIGATQYHLSCSYVESGGAREMSAIELAAHLEARTQKWCWTTSGRTLPIPVGEVNADSIRTRKLVDQLGLGWSVDSEGTYSLTVYPQRVHGYRGSEKLVGGGKLLWSGQDPASERLDYLLGWLQELSWVLRAEGRPGSFEYHLQKLVGLILAAQDSGMGPGRSYFDIRTALGDE